MTPLVSFGMFLVLAAVSLIGVAVAGSIVTIAVSNWRHREKELRDL